MKNVKQLSPKESIKLVNKVYKLELELKEKMKMLANKENSINALINEMVDLQNDLKYEVKLNLKLKDKLKSIK
jgi:ribosomal protein S13